MTNPKPAEAFQSEGVGYKGSGRAGEGKSSSPKKLEGGQMGKVFITAELAALGTT